MLQLTCLVYLFPSYIVSLSNEWVVTKDMMTDFCIRTSRQVNVQSVRYVHIIMCTYHTNITMLMYYYLELNAETVYICTHIRI